MIFREIKSLQLQYKNPLKTIPNILVFYTFRSNNTPTVPRQKTWKYLPNMIFSVNASSKVTETVSMEGRSDALLGVVLWWVWFCMSFILAQPFENRLDLQKNWKKVEKTWFYRIFVRAITLWKYFCSTKNKNNGNVFSHCLELIKIRYFARCFKFWR